MLEFPQVARTKTPLPTIETTVKSTRLQHGSILDFLRAGTAANASDTAVAEAPAMRPCILEQRRPCCHGYGINLMSKGAFTAARLCDCLKSCRNCLGSAQKVEDGFAKTCHFPSPHSLVNKFNAAAIPVRYRNASLQEFQNKTGNYEKILSDIRGWQHGFLPLWRENKAKGLIIGGTVGVGKTFLLTAIGKWMLLNGLSVKFVDFFQLITALKGQMGTKQESYQALLDAMVDVDILLIDELGKGRQTEFEHTIIDQLVMGRYNQNKVIVATTNCPLFTDAKAYAMQPLDQRGGSTFNPKYYPPLGEVVGERIYSRMIETTVMMELKGSDYRSAKGRS
jgi:DNA replication protein DnaC